MRAVNFWKAVRPTVAAAYNHVFLGRFYRLKKGSRGMCSPRVYKEIYDRVRELPDLDVVEVGAGAGATSIAAAWALQGAGHSGRVIAIEKCEGGSRSDYGDKETNLTIIQRHFQAFGVSNKVVLYAEYLTFDNVRDVLDLLRTPQIAALIHDADGRLDRDFSFFWPRLIPGGLLVIDDYENRCTFQPRSVRYPDGGIKSILTYRLLNQFMAWDLVRKHCIIRRRTFFGYKPAGADFSRFDSLVCQRIIREVEAEYAAWWISQKGGDVTEPTGQADPPRSASGRS